MPLSDSLDIYNGCLRLDLHQRDDLSATRAGAGGRDRIPAFSTFEVRVPERPRPALRGPDLVNRAFSSRPVEKGAVAVCELA